MCVSFTQFLKEWKEESKYALQRHLGDLDYLILAFNPTDKIYYKGIGLYTANEIPKEELLEYVTKRLTPLHILTSATKSNEIAQMFAEGFSTHEGHCDINVILEVSGEMEYDYSENLEEQEVILYKPRVLGIKSISYKKLGGTDDRVKPLNVY